MKRSLFRYKKDWYQNIVNEDFNNLISCIVKDSCEKYIIKLCEAIPYIKDKESWKHSNRIPRGCSASKYFKNMYDERIFEFRIILASQSYISSICEAYR